MKLSKKELAVIYNMRQAGCTIVAFIPEELGVVKPEDVEEHLYQIGWKIIFNLNQKTKAEAAEAAEAWEEVEAAWAAIEGVRQAKE